MKIHHFGYARFESQKVVERIKEVDGLLVDVRLEPYGKSGFSRAELIQALGNQYLWIPEWGNLNYKPKDRAKGIQIADFEKGLERLNASIYGGDIPSCIVLMCGCDRAQSCHRIEVLRLLKANNLGLKTIIAGSRSIKHLSVVERAIEKSGFTISEVVSGRARGVDRLGEAWAKQNHVPVKQFPAKWQRPDGTTDRSAGFRRNTQMAAYAEALIAIWDGKSKGTAHMINSAKKAGLKVFVHKVRLAKK